MKTNIFPLFSKTIKAFPENILFLITGAIILCFPLIATIGQYLDTDYFRVSAPVLLFYWPGSAIEFKIQIFVWLIMGLIFASYAAGIFYMLRKRTLGKVILITIALFIFSTLLKSFLAGTFGLKESALPDLAGKANAAIFASWHNPIWEEIVFRGIPLLILLAIEKYITKKRTLAGVILYCLIPSVVCGFYHIPGHGLIRFFDTLIIGAGFSWMALRYTFFAPVVMHYIADAMLVLSLNKVPTIQPSEVGWIIRNGPSLNTFSSMFVLVLVVLIPVLIILYFLRFKKLRDAGIQLT